MMSPKKLDMIAFLLTVLVLFVVAIAFVFVQLLALNGVMDSRATTALVLLILGELTIMSLSGVFAAWASSFLIAKFQWKRALAVVVSVTLAAFLGSALFFFAVILSILLAGIK